MSDTEKPTDLPIAAELVSTTKEDVALPGKESSASANSTISNGTGETLKAKEPVASDAPADEVSEPKLESKPASPEEVAPENKPLPTRLVENEATSEQDTKSEDGAPIFGEPADLSADTPASTSKPKNRRKSGVPEHKGKKLNKKASKARIMHIDAKPGDYFYVRLKGYPLWPAIVCDESMLPPSLLKNRPVAAAREDGTYRDDYADGGSKAKDRSFPVMYLHTNEFGWIPNYDLLDLDFETVADVPASRKDLAAAHQLAAEQHDLDYFKTILQQFKEEKEAKDAEIAAKLAAKAAKKATPSKKEKKSAKTVAEDEDGDLDMPDADLEESAEDTGSGNEGKKPLKRKHIDTVQESESVKKPRLKLNNTTPKAPNGTSTPKTAKAAKEPKEQSAAKSAKSAKSKPKKAAAKAPETPEVVAPPKQPEQTAEQLHEGRQKEIMFLRHKLQKGLLTKDQEPKEEEMKQMSEFITKLEGYAVLESSIIRGTKINKVLKAILKLPVIPKEEEFKFKPRSSTLLEKWNKLLSSEQGTPAVAPKATTTNGASADAKAGIDDVKASLAETTNGVKEESSAEAKVEKVFEEKTTADAADAKEETAETAEDAATEEETVKTEPAAVESTA